MWGLELTGGEQQIPAGCGEVWLEAAQSILPLYPALESGVITAISRMLFLTPKPFLFPYSNHKLYHFAPVAETNAEVRVETHAGECHRKYTGTSSMRAFGPAFKYSM